MARLRDESARLKLGSYPRTVEIRTIYGDVDSFQHLNNVALARFFEEGRAVLNMELFGVETVVRPTAGVQLLFASVAIEHLAQGTYPGSVTVATGISAIGRSSFSQSAAIFQGETCLAVCEAATVYAVDGKGQALPDSVRSALSKISFAG